LMMSLWDALRMNMMISYQELVRTFLRKDFEYYINKTRKKNLQNNQEIQDFINEEMSYEREFSWRGVMLNSLSSDQENFRIFIELVYSVKYILNVE
ncbi:hypothetical protein ACR2U5_23150, partial [Klebsiella pneumoniae]